MKYEVELTIRAREDWQEIYRYIADALQSEQNAVGQTGRIEKAIFRWTKCPSDIVYTRKNRGEAATFVLFQWIIMLYFTYQTTRK